MSEQKDEKPLVTVFETSIGPVEVKVDDDNACPAEYSDLVRAEDPVLPLLHLQGLRTENEPPLPRPETAVRQKAKD